MNEDTNENNQTIVTNKSNKRSKMIESVLDKIAPTRHVPLSERLSPLTLEQKLELQAIEDNAIINFSGMLNELESALGMLRIGHHFGWKMLYILHSKKTIRKYEEILNIKVRNVFQEEGPSSDRSIGLGLAKNATNFWKAVSGEFKIENRREVK